MKRSVPGAIMALHSGQDRLLLARGVLRESVGECAVGQPHQPVGVGLELRCLGVQYTFERHDVVAREVSGKGAATTLIPSAFSGPITLPQLDPSAQAPCGSTTSMWLAGMSLRAFPPATHRNQAAPPSGG